MRKKKGGLVEMDNEEEKVRFSGDFLIILIT